MLNRTLLSLSSVVLCASVVGCTDVLPGEIVEVAPSDVYLAGASVVVLGAQLNGSFGGVDVTGPANIQLGYADASYLDLQLTTPDGRALLALTGSGFGGFGPPPSLVLGMACTGSSAYSFENELPGEVVSTEVETAPSEDGEKGPILKTLGSSVHFLDGGDEVTLELELALAPAE